MNAVKVLVADPTDDGPDQIAALLSRNPRIDVIATARTGAECIRKATLTHPHVITMDLQFKDLAAAQIISSLSRLQQKVAVYLIGPHVARENPLLADALKAGAFDFIRCRRNGTDLQTYERQIRNTIFVAGLSATKQIPRREGTSSTPGLSGVLHGKSLVLVGFAAERVAEMSVFFTGAKVGPAADLVLVVCATRERAAPGLADLRELVGYQVEELADGGPLTGGHFYVTTKRPEDVVIQAGPGGGHQVGLAASRGGEAECPRLDVLFKSAAEKLGNRVGAIVVGGDGTDGIYGLRAIGDSGGTTLVDDQSVDFMSALRQWLPGLKVPRGIAPLDDLRLLLREIA
jgi:two-component system chemotaxis response regulator CheB